MINLLYNRLIDTRPILDELAVNDAVFVYSASSTSFPLLSLATVGLRNFSSRSATYNRRSFCLSAKRKPVCGAHLRRFSILLFSFVFPTFLEFSSLLSRFVRSRRPRVRPANFSIKQSDARTVSVMNGGKGKRKRQKRIEPVRG